MPTVDEAIAEAFGGPLPQRKEKPVDPQALARAAAKRYGLDEDIFLKLVGQESNFNNAAVSNKGAQGLGQLMPDTAQELGVDPKDPAQNLEGSARYLKQQLDTFGDYNLALAAYNAGPGNVRKYGGIPPFPETQDYVKTIMGGGDTTLVPTKPQAPQMSVDDALGKAFGTTSAAVQEAFPAAKAGFLDSAKAVPEVLGRMIAGGLSNPLAGTMAAGDWAGDRALATTGDQGAANRVGAQGLLASTVASLAVPGAGTGASLAAKAGLGALGGGLSGGAEAALTGEEILPAAGRGALMGGTIGLGFGAVQGVLAKRAADRLLKAGKPVPGALADKIKDAPAQDLAETLGIQNPLQRILKALEEAPMIRKAQERLYSAERGARISAARAARAPGTGGREGYLTQLSKMAGPMKRLDFEAPVVSPQDVDYLFNQVDIHPALDDFERLTAQRGLTKMFGEMGGQVPTTDELKKLGTVFGNPFVEAMLKKQPQMSRLARMGFEVAGTHRALVTSFDLSAPMRQGLFLGAGNPKAFARSFFQMFKYAGSEKAFQEVNQNIVSRETYPLMKRAGLALNDLDSVLGQREEVFGGKWADKIPGIRASNRAYAGFLNKFRSDVFDSMVKDAQRMGTDPWADPGLASKIADYVNAASGRGRLGKIGKVDLEKSADALNLALFSPRLIASRMTLLNPATYITTDPVVRRQALRSLLGMSSLAATVAGVGKMSGLEVEPNPKSADFGKLKVGNTRYDMFGGFLQYIRAAANLLPFTGGPDQGTRLEYAGRFGRTKLSPLAGFATDLLDQKDALGNPIDTPEAVATRFMPMVIQDVWKTIQEWGPVGAAMATPAVFGAGVQTYE